MCSELHQLPPSYWSKLSGKWRSWSTRCTRYAEGMTASAALGAVKIRSKCAEYAAYGINICIRRNLPYEGFQLWLVQRVRRETVIDYSIVFLKLRTSPISNRFVCYVIFGSHEDRRLSADSGCALSAQKQKGTSAAHVQFMQLVTLGSTLCQLMGGGCQCEGEARW